MSVTRALNVLNIPSNSTHNLDIRDLGEHVRQLQRFSPFIYSKVLFEVKKMIQEIEQRRVECVRLLNVKSQNI